MGKGGLWRPPTNTFVLGEKKKKEKKKSKPYGLEHL